MKRLLLALALLASLPAVAQETPIYCVASTLTVCNTVSNPGNHYQGDSAWLAFGKLNAWGTQLGILANQPANEVLATPSGASGIPGVRALIGADIPPINLAGGNQNGGVAGILPVGDGGTGLGTVTANDCLVGNTGGTGYIFLPCAAAQVYPGAGLAISTGTAWGTSITLGTGMSSFLGLAWPSLLSSDCLTNNGTALSWGACGGGSGTVNSGTSGQVGCYAATGTAISGCGSLNVGASSVAATVPLGLDSFATASAPTCTPGQIGYANDGTGALAVCNNSDTWVSNGGTTFTIAGTGCTPTAVTGDATGGSFTLAAGPCTAVTVTFNGAVGMTAGHLWDCGVHDQTALAAGTWIPGWSQSSSTTTTATIPIPPAAVADEPTTYDTITFTCVPH